MLSNIAFCHSVTHGLRSNCGQKILMDVIFYGWSRKRSDQKGKDHYTAYYHPANGGPSCGAGQGGAGDGLANHAQPIWRSRASRPITRSADAVPSLASPSVDAAAWAKVPRSCRRCPKLHLKTLAA